MEGEYKILKSAIDQLLEEKRKDRGEAQQDTIEELTEEDTEMAQAELLEY
jgi:hypothetical protein